MTTKLKLIYVCALLLILNSCNTDSNIINELDSDASTYIESASDLNITGSNISGVIEENRLKELVKHHHKLKEIPEEQYPVLLVQMLSNELKEHNKASSNLNRVQSTGSIFCLAQVTINGTTYSDFDQQPYDTNNIFATQINQLSNVPVGSYIEAYVVHFPEGQSQGVTLSQDQLTTSDITCSSDEIARAQATWQNQLASTSALLTCIDPGNYPCNNSNSVCAVYESVGFNFYDLVERNRFSVEWDHFAIPTTGTVTITLNKANGTFIKNALTENTGFADDVMNFPRVSSNTRAYITVSGGGVTLTSRTFTIEND